MSARSRVPTLLASLLSATLLAGLSYKLLTSPDLYIVASRLDTTRFAVSFAAAATFTTGIYLFLGAYKWRMMLERGCGIQIGYGECLRLWTVSSTLDPFVPFGAGKLATGLPLKRDHGVPLASTASTIIYKKYLNAIATTGLVVVAGLLRVAGGQVGDVDLAILAVAVAGGALLILAGRHAALLSSRWPRLESLLRDLTSSFAIPRSDKALLLLLSLIIQLSRVVAAFLVFRGMGIAVDPGRMLFYYPVVMLLASLPLTIGGWGLREIFVITLFAGLAGFEALFVGGALMSIIEVAIPAALGAIALAVSGKALLGAAERTP